MRSSVYTHLATDSIRHCIQKFFVANVIQTSGSLSLKLDYLQLELALGAEGGVVAGVNPLHSSETLLW